MSGKTITFTNLKNLADRFDPSVRIDDLVEVAPIGRKECQIVRFLDQDFAKFCRHNKSDKASTSLYNDGHSVTNDVAELTLYKAGEDRNLDPLLITVSKGSPRNAASLLGASDTLFIVENVNLFYRLHALKTIKIDASWDVACGRGNSIANPSLIQAIDNHYQRIQYFMDFDIGGLKTFRSLKKKCQRIDLYVPENIETAFKMSKWRLTPSEKQKAVSLCIELGLTDLQKKFALYGTKINQEIFQ